MKASPQPGTLPLESQDELGSEFQDSQGNTENAVSKKQKNKQTNK